MVIKNKLLNKAILFIFILISLFLFECLVRYFLGPPVGFMSNTILDPILGYRCNPKLKGIDSNGFRNDRLYKQVDIVTLGDSHTFGNGVESVDSWPQQLSRMSGLSVYNFGVGGYGGIQYKYLIDQAIELHPKYIILGLYVANDISDMGGFSYWERKPLSLDWKSGGIAKILKDIFYSINQRLSLGSAAYSKLKDVIKKIRPAIPGVEISVSYGNEVKKIKIALLGEHAVATELKDRDNKKRYDLFKQILIEIKEKSEKAEAKFGIIFIPSVENVLYDYLADNKYNFPEVYLTEVNNERFLVNDLKKYLDELNVCWVDVLPYVSRLVYQGYKLYQSWEDAHPLKIGYKEYAHAAYDLMGKISNKQKFNKKN